MHRCPTPSAVSWLIPHLADLDRQSARRSAVDPFGWFAGRVADAGPRYRSRTLAAALALQSGRNSSLHEPRDEPWREEASYIEIPSHVRLHSDAKEK